MRNKLDMKQQFDLITLVQTEYSSSKMNDKEFAAHATAKIGCRPLTADHIGRVRKAYGIVGNMAARAAINKPTTRLGKIDLAIKDLAARVAAMEAQLNKEATR
jgi:hypothetical protein